MTPNRSLALLLCATLAPLTPACYSQSTIPGGKLGGLRHGEQGGDTVFYTAEGDAVRLDPNSNIRFRRRDGSLTPWRSARELSVNDDGVFTVREVLPEALHSAHVQGLGEAETEALRRTRPLYAVFRDMPDGSIEISDDGGSLIPWMESFAHVVSRLYAPPGDSDDAALEHLTGPLAGKPLGRWTFHCAPSVGPYAGSALLKAWHDGVLVVDGVRWADVDSAEVHNLDGGQTLVAVVAVSALVVGLVAVATLSKGKISLPIPKLGETTVHVASHAVRAAAETVEVAARVAPHVHIHGGSGGGGSSSSSGTTSSNGNGGNATPTPVAAGTGSSESDESDTVTLWKPGFDAPIGNDARPIFGGVARRRSQVGMVLSVDAARDFSNYGRMQTSVSGAFRIVDFLELGGGLRWLGGDYGTGVQGNLVPFAHFGMHGELDAHKRFAFMVGTDFGKWNDVLFHFKLSWGMRIRVANNWWIGVEPFNPTFTRHRPGTAPEAATAWSFPSGVETTFVF